MASFYGNESGSKTASGQRFNQNAMTAAHRTLPFGTKLRVTHGSRSVVVTINDRGPFIRGRVLDLSTGAARAVGLTGARRRARHGRGHSDASAFAGRLTSKRCRLKTTCVSCCTTKKPAVANEAGFLLGSTQYFAG